MGAEMHLGICWPKERNFSFVPSTVDRKKSHFAYILFLHYQKLKKNNMNVKHVKIQYIMLYQDGIIHLIKIQNMNNVLAECPS
jgi:hypothetical protein